MRFLFLRTGVGDRGHRLASAGRGLAAALLLALAPAAKAAAQVPDTVGIVNRATLRYTAPGGIEGGTEASVRVTVKLTAGVRIAPPRQASVRPGERRAFAHLLENRGTGADRFRLEAAGPAGWGLSLHLDVDGDGALGAGDTPVSGPLPLERGGSQALLLVVDVPADAADEAEVALTVRATSQMDAAVADSVRDVLAVHRPLAAATLGKTVDRAEATAGDTLTYTLSYANRGDAVAPGAALADPLPAGVRFVAGSLRWNGAALTEAADADAGVVERAADGRETVRVRLGDLVPAAAGTVTFRVVVAADAGGALANVAELTYTVEGGAPVSVPSPTTQTRVGQPAMTVAKELAGADSVELGSNATYRIRWANASATLAVREAVVVDSLPAGLVFVSADGSPEVEGQVVRWRLGTLAPGQSGTLSLTVRVETRPAEGAVVNRVSARGANSGAATGESGPLHVRDFEGDELEVKKAAGVLEAGLGDAVPYAVTLRNTGLAPIRGIVLRDSLPEGVRYLEDRLSGADSARVSGRELTIWVAGPLAPGVEHVVRYAVSVVSPGRASALENRVTAEAEGGRVRSAQATAWVRLRRGFAMQQRVVVGKVWLDADGDGRQGAGEGGVAGVEVWSEDGEVVTTDREGRFSFPNLRAGSHALRLDTLGIPAGFGFARRGDEIVRVRLDGWTLPRADFRLVPRTAGDRGQGTGDSQPGSGAVPASSSVPAGIVPATSTTTGAALTPAVNATQAGTNGAAAPSTVDSAPAGTNGGTNGVAGTNGAATRAASMPAGAVRDVAGPLGPPAAEAPARPKVDSIPTVAPLRTAEERAEEESRTFATGPVVRIASPLDGAVVASNRLYVGLRGEAGAEVKVFDGEKQVAEGRLRPDGKIDFVGVELAPGPHRLRAWMRTSWGERWDSVAIHRSGAPATFELPSEAATLRAGDRAESTLRVRVLDGWGVPLAGGAAVTVEAAGATVAGADADGSSVGTQAAVGRDGFAEVRLRPGQDVGPGELRVSAGEAKGRVPLRVLPSTRPLIVTGAGQVGVGAAPEAFGSVTVRGAVDGETSVSVTYDSRRGGEEDDFFQRGFDPLEEGRYPTFGDGSRRRVLGSATQSLTARVERGYDWVEMGDVRTADFGVDGRLGFYQRALTGVSGRVTTGAVTWRGFGSLTDQVLTQRQLRGDGSSGPYRFGGGIRPGTERVAIEVRDRDNAARVIARQELARFNDYQVDYLSGEVLLNHPVPAADAAGNPVFVVALLEARSGGDAKFVGGLRMDLDAGRALRLRGLDTLSVSLLGVRDEGGEAAAGAAGGDLLGGGLRLRRGGLLLGGQLLRSMRPDSSALAARAEFGWAFLPKDRARLTAEWLRVGEGFAPGTDPRLAAGMQEIRVAAEVRPAEGTRVRLAHERQRFDGYDVERASTTVRAEQQVAGRPVTAEGGVTSDSHGETSASAAVAKVTMAVSPDLSLWVEGTQALSLGEGPAAAVARPDQVGLGASYRLLAGTRLEAVHRWVRTHGDSASSYGLTSLNLRTERLLGGQLWGGVERADLADGRANHSAVLGWNQRLALAGGWAVTGLYERRFGLDRASLLDPTRALPFVQPDRDRWSTGAGVEWLVGDSTPRFSLRGEVHGGAESRGRRFDLSADAPLGPSAALLTRHDWWQEERSSLAGGTEELSRRDRSLVGLALRPVGSDALNVLAKVEWRRTINPLGGGVLAGTGDERRLIGATDAVWAVRPGTEVAGRYAVRWASLADTATAGAGALTSFAHFLGARGEQTLFSRLRARLDGRMLIEGEGGARHWNLAPALVGDLGGGLELEGGYRFGGLRDPDFAAQGGDGFYATLNLRFTERTLGDVAAFWRERLARGEP